MYMSEEEVFKRYYDKSLKTSNWVKGNGSDQKFYIPGKLNKTGNDIWVSTFKLLNYLNPGITSQIYYDIVVLGISNPNDRPKCKYCGKESKFKIKGIDKRRNEERGYFCYCNDCSRKYAAELTSKKLTGRNLSSEHKAKLSLAKKGKKLTEDQRLRRPRGYHFSLTLEQRAKIGLSKRGKTKSRNYYKSGIFVTLKAEYPHRINFLSSYELDFLRIADKNKSITKISIPEPIEYGLKDGSLHYYYPDFLVTLDNGKKVLIEVKAYNLINDEKVILKRVAGMLWCKKMGMTYITLTERDIYLKRRLFDPSGLKRINYNLSLFKYII